MKHIQSLQKKILPLPIVSVVFLVFLIIVLIVINIILQKKISQTLYTKADGPVCDPQCATEPACCANIIKKLNELGGPDGIMDLPDDEQPYHECPGLYDSQNERGYCRSDVCNQLPEGVRYRGRCGWYWSFHEGATNTANGYGCMIGPADNMKKICDGGTFTTPTPNPSNPTSPPTSSTTPNPSNPPGNNGTTTLRIEVWITKSGQARRLWNAGDGTGVVYIKGPTASGADRFSVEMRVPTSSGVFQDTEGHFFRGEPGVVLWAGAGTSEGDPGAGTSPGRYTTNMSSLPSGLGPVPYPNVFATISQGQTGVAILDVVEGQVNISPTPTLPPGVTPTVTPTPDGNTPTATPTPTPGGNGNLSTGYTNADYQRIINQYAEGEITALEVSVWISEASRSPGLQLSTCDPTIPGDCGTQ